MRPDAHRGGTAGREDPQPPEPEGAEYEAAEIQAAAQEKEEIVLLLRWCYEEVSLW